MPFTRATARSVLEASLLDAARVFGESGSVAVTAALNRHLDGALRDFNRVLPRIEEGAFPLVAGVGRYTAPPLAIGFHTAAWIAENAARPPYDPLRLPTVPVPSISWFSGVKVWSFSPVPTAAMLSVFGPEYRFSWKSGHALHENDASLSTVDDVDQPLLITRAQVESLRELAIRNAHKPMAVRDTQYSQTRNGTPAGLMTAILEQWEQQAREASERYLSGARQ